ncbi:hypothetical protein AAG570_008458 [Ranatra chinensis]|uniref:SH3 domain-containing protein n=1 Tax=Ranatra chinensis TaxID=642074 RepID=A0ABD0YT50_9HEMI
MAVAKVEELTRQLEEVRRGKAQQAQQPPGQASQELERLRRELMYRNKLNEQQTARLSEQREALCQRQMEMASIDKRIAELQDRLHRKRMLNQQLANQITAASNKANTGNQQNIRSAMQMPGLQQQQMYQGIPSVGKPMMRPVPSGNIAAVEPYHHVPSYTTTNVEQEYMKRQEIKPDQPPQRVYNNTNQDELMGPRKPNLTAPATHHYVHELKKEEKHETENLSEFGASKSDPKYQTLPYNTKFAMNSSPVLKAATKRASGEGNENITENIEAAKHNTINNNHNNNHNNNNFNHINNNVNQLNVAHSIPIQAGANKGLAMALANQKHSPIPSSASSTSSTSSTNYRVYGNNLLTSSLMARGQPVGGASSTTSSTSSLATNSSASSTNGLQVSCSLPSGCVPLTQFNTASRLTLPPTPLISDVQVVVKEETETNKPALPPKPAVPAKPTPPPPPRQTQNSLEIYFSQCRGGKLNSEYPNQYPVEITEAPPPPPSTEPPSDEPIFNRRTAEPIIKARPLTIKKQPISELPRLRNFIHKDDTVDDKRVNSEDIRRLERNEEDVGLRKVEDGSEESGNGLGYGNSRRIEMPPAYLFPETETPPADLVPQPEVPSQDQTDRSATPEDLDDRMDSIPRRVRKGNLKGSGEKQCLSRRVSFDPLALLLDASLEGELELVMRTASQVRDPSAANDEGITALHNAICAGHFDIVTFLVKFGCDVNAQDSDGWTPLHCAASCNNVAMVRFLVEHGACIFATTLSDHETAAEKCEEDEEGFDGCSEYLYSVQEKLGIMNSGVVYAVFDYDAHNSDELSFKEGDKLVVLRKGDEWEREWWWARLNDAEGYIPRNLLGVCFRYTYFLVLSLCPQFCYKKYSQ